MKRTSHDIKKDYLHQRNQHRNGYDFVRLIEKYDTLKPYVSHNKYGNLSLDFFNPSAVVALNTILIKEYYNIQYWDIPTGYLCPAVPGRAEYIHRMADLIDIKPGQKITCLDVGTGASLIYPIIGTHEYSWHFIATDISEHALHHAQSIIDKNKRFKGVVELRHQLKPKAIFQHVIKPGEYIYITLCNPPFYASAAEAKAATRRKVSNLTGQRHKNPIKNFQGQPNELWCKGGELQFVTSMINESEKFKNQVNWFSTLISKESILTSAKVILAKKGPKDIQTINLSLGNKNSRALAWRF